MPSRPLSKEAQPAQDALLAAFLRLYLRLERVKAGLAKKAVAALAAIPDPIAADLRRAQMVEAARPETRLLRLKDFSSDAMATVQDAYKRNWKNLRADLATAAKRVSGRTLDAMNQAAGFNLAEYAPDGDVLRGVPYGADILGPTVSVWLGRQAVQLGQRIADIARAGVLGGDPAVLDKVERDALLQAQVRLDALARSAVAAVAADAVMATLKANRDVVRGVQWMSVLDNHTTEQCQGLNGKAWDLEGKPISHDQKFPGEPPIHWGCRNMLIPILKPWSEL